MPFDDEEEILIFSSEDDLEQLEPESQDSWELTSDENVSQKNIVVEIQDSEGKLFILENFSFVYPKYLNYFRLVASLAYVSRVSGRGNVSDFNIFHLSF